jgi:hypothetical protein
MSYHKCFCRDAAVLLIIGQQQFTPRCILNNPFAAGPHVELPQGSGRRSDDAKPLALRLGRDVLPRRLCDGCRRRRQHPLRQVVRERRGEQDQVVRERRGEQDQVVN